ncbi:MAG: radical SAM protein, partial [Bdellovibrionota bacterium]
EAFDQYQSTVEAVVRFLQGQDPSLAARIASRTFLPEGPRFLSSSEEHLEWAFGALGVQDRAKHVATLYLEDLADVLRDGIDEHFLLSRYAEKLAASVPTFEPLFNELQRPLTLIDKILREITAELLEQHQPDLVGLSVPFPGNVFGAFRIAQFVKELTPRSKIVMGGGYVNTELRELAEPRVFEFIDFVTLDDGERPIECITQHLQGKRNTKQLLRTFMTEKGKVVYQNSKSEFDIPFSQVGTPTYDGLPLSKYISIFEILNPMHRLWSDARWNKLTLAHGCYWKKCSFCDVSLDYISRYEPATADVIVDRMQALINETGQTGFHFVDEAAPPALLKALSERLVARGVVTSWWGNVRFEKTFTLELTQKMADAGCIAVSGGLEVASDRLLKLMQKGVTVEQVARVTRAFREAGILVHAYLMYGFPTQTQQETIDSLELVRQLFLNDCIQSAYWHRFSATAHSPIGKDPEKFGIELVQMPDAGFAKNDLLFEDPTGCDHDALGRGLQKAVFNYMHGIGLEEDVRAWFEDIKKVPRTTVEPSRISRALEDGGNEPHGRMRVN